MPLDRAIASKIDAIARLHGECERVFDNARLVR